MFRPTLLALALVAGLAGCSHVAPPLQPVADVTQASSVGAEWLGPAGQAVAEQEIARYLQAETKDGLVQVTSIAIDQRLIAVRYPFTAIKRVVRPLRTFTYRVTGFYSKADHQITVTCEAEVVDPTL